MDKRTPNKRKSLAKTNTTPTKIQKTADTPLSQKKNKSPKSANKNQKKQLNGKQNTPKGKKKSKQTEEDETELMNESDENETDNSIEQAENDELNGNSDDSDADESNEDDEESDDEANEDESNEEVKTDENKPAKIPDADRKFSAYVGGFDYNFTESDLEDMFDDTNVLSVLILRNPKTNKSKGSGFINFKDAASLQKALLKDETEVNGRKIRVNLPHKRDKNSDQISKKKDLLKKIQSDVQNLVKEMSGTDKKKKFGKPINDAKNKNVKFNKKNNAKKATVK